MNKEYIKELFHYITIPILLFSFALYLTYYDRLKEISKIFINIIPSLIFFIGAILTYTRNRGTVKYLNKKNENTKILTLTKFDIYFIISLMFIVFCIIVIIPILFGKEINALDLFQGIIAVTGIYIIRKYYIKFRIKWISQDVYEIDDTFEITYNDTMKIDILSFGVAFFIVAIPGFITRNLEVNDIIQAVVGYLFIYWINVKYFYFP